MTPRLLSSISRDIRNGRPLWGMLRANEYFSISHPLRKALLKRVIDSSDCKALDQNARKILFEGSSLSELGCDTAILLQHQEPYQVKRRFIPSTQYLFRQRLFRKIDLRYRRPSLEIARNVISRRPVLA